jgi:sec-independent protein translocase protein TatC
MTSLKPKEEIRKFDIPMSVEDHIEDFRKRVIYILLGTTITVVICLFIGPKLISYMRELYISIMVSEGLEPRLQILAPSDGFITYIKISVFAGVVLAAPWIFYQLWQYIATGLYSKEKRLVNIAAPISAFLFVSGAFFFLKVVAPFTLRFFIVFNKTILGAESSFTFQKYVSFITQMILIFGFAFQTPTAIFFLNKSGLVSLERLSKLRKYIFLAVFIIAAIITPPDFVSQVTLAIPLYLLFELGVLLSQLANRH